jgi:hypothetical protein
MSKELADAIKTLKGYIGFMAFHYGTLRKELDEKLLEITSEEQLNNLLENKRFDDYCANLRYELRGAIDLAYERDLEMTNCRRIAEALDHAILRRDPVDFEFEARVELDRLISDLLKSPESGQDGAGIINELFYRRWNDAKMYDLSARTVESHRALATDFYKSLSSKQRMILTGHVCKTPPTGGAVDHEQRVINRLKDKSEDWVAKPERRPSTEKSKITPKSPPALKSTQSLRGNKSSRKS